MLPPTSRSAVFDSEETPVVLPFGISVKSERGRDRRSLFTLAVSKESVQGQKRAHVCTDIHK
jgi:hypothetical protein